MLSSAFPGYAAKRRNWTQLSHAVGVKTSGRQATPERSGERVDRRAKEREGTRSAACPKLYAIVAAVAQNAGARRSTAPPVLDAIVAAFAQNAGAMRWAAVPVPCVCSCVRAERGWRCVGRRPRALRDCSCVRVERGWRCVGRRPPGLYALVAAFAQNAGAMRWAAPPVLYAFVAAWWRCGRRRPPCSTPARLLREHGYGGVSLAHRWRRESISVTMEPVVVHRQRAVPH